MSFDYVLVGGGLAGGLTALALLSHKPTARVAVVERDRALGGNHTWSLHATDVPHGAESMVADLVVHRWDGYDVAFPSLRRTIRGGYATIPSPRLHEVLSARLAGQRGCELLLSTEAVSVGKNEVRLSGGRALEGEVIIDARGPAGAQSAGGWQKFLGLEVALEGGGAGSRPFLMEATCEQVDGLRFFYVLPLARDRLLVEETFFSDVPELDRERSQTAILSWLDERGLRPAAVLRTETGCLPMPWAAPQAAPEGGDALRLGWAGGFFHPATGYSVPVALRMALALCRGTFESCATAVARQARFARLLNRLLFRAMAPADRWRALARFYSLPEPTIARFYALELTRADRLRILCRRPPQGVSLGVLLRPNEVTR